MTIRLKGSLFIVFIWITQIASYFYILVNTIEKIKMIDKKYVSALSQRMMNSSHWRKKQVGKTDQNETQFGKGLESERTKALTKMSLCCLVVMSSGG